ncbi:MAG: response regulator [Deltaproteobacteria bacterium]|nr:response regulator [Deltaproteobacteria bacterium]
MKEKILLVDNNENIRKDISNSLDRLGYHVYTAQNGEEALAVFKEVNPPVVITDIRMPVMNGIELLRRIKSQSPDTEVIIITAHGNVDFAIRSLKDGATDFLLKPISYEVLETAFRRVHERIEMRRRARESAENRAMYDTAVNNLIQEDVMVIAPDYRILEVNDTFLKKLPYDREEIIGRHCYEISHQRRTPCDGEEELCPLKDTLLSGKPSKSTHVHRGKDNQEIYHAISTYPIFKDGEIKSVIEILRDVTKDIHLHKEMLRQQKMISVGRLAAGVAHEINNPLTTILTTAMLMQEDLGQDDPDYLELKTIADEAIRCRKIISSLLNFARQSRPVIDEHDINDIVQDSIVLLRKQAAFKDVTLESKFEAGIPIARVDKAQIQQSLVNLGLNAIDAIEPGGEVIFETRFSSADSYVEVVVSDNGKGIPREHLDKIFDPFFTTKEVGTGLGMSITLGLIKQHKGTIHVESSTEKGTTFTVRLPVGSGKSNE